MGPIRSRHLTPAFVGLLCLGIGASSGGAEAGARPADERTTQASKLRSSRIAALADGARFFVPRMAPYAPASRWSAADAVALPAVPREPLGVAGTAAAHTAALPHTPLDAAGSPAPPFAPTGGPSTRPSQHAQFEPASPRESRARFFMPREAPHARASRLATVDATATLAAGTLAAPMPTPRYQAPDTPHEFTFTRAIYSSFGRRWRGGRSWATDYPKADRQFILLIQRLVGFDIAPEENAIRLDDPELRR
ncbi:MAG TPA: hypothetical protein VF158_08805, partial [Longimicrobiales bacterium]